MRKHESWVGDKINFENARILDNGCGQGIAAASFALRHSQSTVLGVDVEPHSERHLGDILKKEIGRDIPANLRFETVELTKIPGNETFDFIYAWSVFEHIREELLVDTFAALKQRLSKGGFLFIFSNPLYFSPQGSHLYKYFKSPWHHLTLPLDQLREGVVSSDFRASEIREWQQFLQLNRLTALDLMGRASGGGLKRLRHHMSKTELVPPPRLTRVYDNDALTTTGLTAIFQ